ncbi:MAG TPA: hypothetical protein VII15_06420 [Candidatus Cryosericum sp.]
MAGQIVAGDTNPMFIDWSNASLSHPFFSMAFFSDEEDLRSSEDTVAIHAQLQARQIARPR